MDIRVIITRSIIYFFLVLFVAAMFTGITFVTGLLFEQTLGANKLLVTLGSSIIIVALLDPIKRLISRTTDSVFFKAKIEYPILLRDLSEVISTEIEIDALVENLTKRLDSGLKVKNSILVLQSKDGSFRVRTLGHPHTEPLVFEQNNPLIKYLNKEDKTIITEELQRKIEDTTEEKGKAELEKSMIELEKIQASAIAPVKTKEKLNAVLLFGPKLSGDVINREEINLIEVLTPQIASAIEKSKLFEEVKGFSETLQKKVDDATVELSERNRFLLSLQKVTNVITRSLDLNKAAQTIVNSIQKDLGYVGGLLLLIDKEKDRIYPAAITQSKLTEKTLKLLPKPIYEYYSSYSEDTTLDTKAAKEQKIKIGNGFEDFVSPPIPKLVCQGIDKLLKVKSLVAVPIFSENEVIGIIDFVLQKPKEEISEREIDLMKSLADQTGIVYRNLKLFEQIKKANEELEEANVRLKALDQAKTEFVSIASHQLRTPMTGIMGYLSMLTSGDFGKLKEEHLKILKELLDESQRMIRLINQFLNVSKIEAGKFELTKREVSLENVMAEKIKEITQAAEKKNLKLIYNPPKKKLPQVYADPDKLSDIILNLIDNAIKYTNKGSVTVSMEHKDSEIQVSVKDTGVGIKKEDAKELFGKFQRGTGIARIQPDGSGLGLFIAKSVVEGHHGRIWAESAGEGKGSTFFFTIPIKK
ncbi:MAG: ATP-binding protein [Patescibacteria group bacterium]